MAIQAKRFEFLDKETNVGINDFINTEDSDIRNIEMPDFKEVAATISDFITPLNAALGQGGDALSDAMGSALSGVDTTGYDTKSLFRETNDLMGLMADIGNMPSKLLDGLLSNLFPNGGQTKNLAKNLFKVCKSAGGNFGSMRPFDVGMNCGGRGLSSNNSNCQASGVAGLLQNLTNGLFGDGFSDINALINAAAMIAMASYGANLCGGFKAGVSMLGGNKNAINRVGAMALSSLATTHGLRGMIDVVNNTDSQMIGSIVPNGAKNTFGNPNLGDKYDDTYLQGQFGIDKRDNDMIYTSVYDTASLLDNDWNTNNGMSSLSNIIDSSLTDVKTNTGMSRVMETSLGNTRLSIDDLNNTNFQPMEDFSAAYVSYNI